MSKTGIIIKREYVRRVSKKSFVLVTLLMPFMAAAMVFVPLWLASIRSGDVKTVAIMDTTGQYVSLFKDGDSFRFINSDKSAEHYRDAGDTDIFAFLQITGNLLQNPKAAALYSAKQIPGELSRLVNQTLARQMEEEKLASFNIPNLREIIRQSQIDFSVQTIKWSADGSENASSASLAAILGMVFTLIIYMFIIMYGSMVMQGVIEEKTNRIVELMISSVRPFELMMGKIIGIALVGLTQLFLWSVMTSALVSGGTVLLAGGADIPATPAMQPGVWQSAGEWLTVIRSVNFVEIGVFFLFYFIGGYLLYAAIFAAVGSAVSQPEDTGQFIAPIMAFMVFALYAGIYSVDNPDGPLAFWCSIIPFTSPVVMMVRLPYDVPAWQLAVSLALLFATAMALTGLSAKIYRVGILMYGKKPSLREIIKWMKY
jgi:ABC-2 type transport system permease protein